MNFAISPVICECEKRAVAPGIRPYCSALYYTPTTYDEKFFRTVENEPCTSSRAPRVVSKPRWRNEPVAAVDHARRFPDFGREAVYQRRFKGFLIHDDGHVSRRVGTSSGIEGEGEARTKSLGRVAFTPGCRLQCPDEATLHGCDPRSKKIIA